MKKQDWAKVLGASAISIFVGLVVLVVIIRAKRKNKLQLNKLFQIIRDDIEYWNGVTETDRKGAEKLREWWANLGQNYTVEQLMSPSFQSSHFWSAVYISNVMKRWGAGDRFKYSARHSDYICDSIRARNDHDTERIFYGYRPHEKPVDVGDIIAVTRESWVTFDNLCGGAPTHTDIVYQLEKTDYGYKAITSGGNVGNTRKSTFVKLDKNKMLISPEKYLALMKNRAL